MFFISTSFLRVFSWAFKIQISSFLTQTWATQIYCYSKGILVMRVLLWSRILITSVKFIVLCVVGVATLSELVSFLFLRKCVSDLWVWEYLRELVILGDLAGSYLVKILHCSEGRDVEQVVGPRVQHPILEFWWLQNIYSYLY